VWNFNQLLRRC